MTDTLAVEVVFAGSESVVRRSLQLAGGATVADAIRFSGIAEHIENLEMSQVGVFGRLVDGATVLRDGDRVEIYRPLAADPQEARRRRVAKARRAAR